MIIKIIKKVTPIQEGIVKTPSTKPQPKINEKN